MLRSLVGSEMCIRDRIEVEDPNLLIGDDDEEDEDDSPKELPSV